MFTIAIISHSKIAGQFDFNGSEIDRKEKISGALKFIICPRNPSSALIVAILFTVRLIVPY